MDAFSITGHVLWSIKVCNKSYIYSVPANKWVFHVSVS